ncbi:MAG: hypothetical protein OXF82_04615, partial [Gammaproteobacteria bacterium]|nr:hypothetical protein [Gammaproteobacteria bacterium]
GIAAYRGGGIAERGRRGMGGEAHWRRSPQRRNIALRALAGADDYRSGVFKQGSTIRDQFAMFIATAALHLYIGTIFPVSPLAVGLVPSKD